MLGIINSIHDREYKICTPEVFDNLTQSAMVAVNIAEYRKGNDACKLLLPAFLFQGYDPNTLLGKKGVRKSSAMQETGFYIMDFDHVDDPQAVYKKFVDTCPELFSFNDVALCHITPSGKGLRLVIKKPTNISIEEAQADMEKRIGVKMDGVVKDLARLSFCPQACDILYINRDLLFSVPKHDEQLSQNSADNGGVGETGMQNTDRSAEQEAVAKRADAFPKYHKGIPLTKIVEELINVLGGYPEVGNRENTLFRLASDMAKITDRSAPWLESILPTFGLPEDEWKATIAQVCRKPIQTSISRNLQEALRRCTFEDTDGNGIITIDEYKDNFPENAPKLIKLLTSRCMPHMKSALAQMCFPALAAHVGNHKFLMYDNSKQELGLMAVLVGKQSSGKSCIDEPIKLICQDIVERDTINRNRQKEYNEKNRNRKANERGEARPEDLIIRCIGGNVTNAALLQYLTAAEEGDKEHPNQTLYSEVQEVQRLYAMASQNGKYGVAELIKAAFDRSVLDSGRSGFNSVNAYTPARWNFTACTTPAGASSFFSGKMLTDGTLSRVSFVLLPDIDIPTNLFNFGNYDKEFQEQLKHYVNNLNNYRHPVDEEGKAIPIYIVEANNLRKKINELIDIEKYIYPDTDTYTAYAYRTRDVVVRQAITTYIANGCVWEDCDDYWMWVYSQQMDTKLDMFGEKAAEQFKVEKPHKGGRQVVLKFMPREFTREQFVAFCKQNDNLTSFPDRTLKRYIASHLITEQDGKFIICDEVCNKYGIK